MTLEDADLRTLPRRAGAGSYGALSRPAENVSQMHAASAGLAALEGLAKNAPVAQLDRALDYESRGQEFESLRARHSATAKASSRILAATPRRGGSQPKISKTTPCKVAGGRRQGRFGPTLDTSGKSTALLHHRTIR